MTPYFAALDADITIVPPPAAAPTRRQPDDFRVAVSNHSKWAVDIKDVVGFAPNYPMIGDTDLNISKAYGMLPAATGDFSEGRTAADNQTVRNVFIIGPDKNIKLILVYPTRPPGATSMRCCACSNSLQLTTKHRVATPANWKQREDVFMLDIECCRFSDLLPMTP